MALIFIFIGSSTKKSKQTYLVFYDRAKVAMGQLKHTGVALNLNAVWHLQTD